MAGVDDSSAPFLRSCHVLASTVHRNTLTKDLTQVTVDPPPTLGVAPNPPDNEETTEIKRLVQGHLATNLETKTQGAASAGEGASSGVGLR